MGSQFWIFHWCVHCIIFDVHPDFADATFCLVDGGSPGNRLYPFVPLQSPTMGIQFLASDLICVGGTDCAGRLPEILNKNHLSFPNFNGCISVFIDSFFDSLNSSTFSTCTDYKTVSMITFMFQHLRGFVTSVLWHPNICHCFRRRVSFNIS